MVAFATSKVEDKVAASLTPKVEDKVVAPATDKPALNVALSLAVNVPLTSALPLMDISPFKDKSLVIMTS